ncbi:hypothetical protein GCM10019059_42530 [Camelimonas fluminis]|uniref:Winged helix domain-containing protein n=1 Tax=Camelimonas fluminis TaxID=1576911 RepID=A0ABV7UMP0_9HYPH|nr:hypothetical protein [Camelimonas fluminis]GHE79533.1 hypothetical protein GCM10019059_42530 [Camelimonas fluminis]
MNVTAITVRKDIDSPAKTYKGREAWALGRLIAAGERGCTPIEQPAPRWSHYVFQLRKSGLDVETVNEKHGGAFSGMHARYVLRTPLQVLHQQVAA